MSHSIYGECDFAPQRTDETSDFEQPRRRVRRQSMPREGMLIQVDGSHHPWLGDQAPPFTLLIAVDDATGTVVDALFCQQEDAHSYFLLIQSLPAGPWRSCGPAGAAAAVRGGLRFDGGGADRCLAQVFPVFAGGWAARVGG